MLWLAWQRPRASPTPDSCTSQRNYGQRGSVQCCCGQKALARHPVAVAPLMMSAVGLLPRHCWMLELPCRYGIKCAPLAPSSLILRSVCLCVYLSFPFVVSRWMLVCALWPCSAPQSWELETILDHLELMSMRSGLASSSSGPGKLSVADVVNYFTSSSPQWDNVEFGQRPT